MNYEISIRLMVSTREKRLSKIAKKLGRTTLNSALPWDAVYDNSHTDGQIIASLRK